MKLDRKSNNLRQRRLVRELHSTDFNKVVDAIHTILDDSKLIEGYKGTWSRSDFEGVNHDWTIDRERLYTIVWILVYLENKDLAFPFYSKNGPSVVHAMLKAIKKFGCFREISYGEFVEIYNRKGLAKVGGHPDYAVQLPEDNFILAGSKYVPYGPEVDDQLVGKFNPEKFNNLVDVIYSVLSEVSKLNETHVKFTKLFPMGNEGDQIDWNISRDHEYVVFPLLQFLEDHTTQFPFQREIRTDEETVIDAMLLAIMRFNCFKNYSHDELLSLYKTRVARGRGLPILNIWGTVMYEELGIFVKRPQ